MELRRSVNTPYAVAYGVTFQTTKFFNKFADKTYDFSAACFLNEWQDHIVYSTLKEIRYCQEYSKSFLFFRTAYSEQL